MWLALITIWVSWEVTPSETISEWKIPHSSKLIFPVFCASRKCFVKGFQAGNRIFFSAYSHLIVAASLKPKTKDFLSLRSFEGLQPDFHFIFFHKTSVYFCAPKSKSKCNGSGQNAWSKCSVNPFCHPERKMKSVLQFV